MYQICCAGKKIIPYALFFIILSLPLQSPAGIHGSPDTLNYRPEMKRIVSLSLYVVVIICLSAAWSCSENRKYRIGISQCSRDDWRSKMNDEIERELMFHRDATAEIRSADDNNTKQIADLRYFADNGFDIIIVSPNEAAALTPVIEEIYRRGIPVIVFDRNIIGDSCTARIGVDDEGIGRSAAHYALHLLGTDARAVEIYGRRGSTPAEARHKGFSDEFTARGGTIAATLVGNWNKDDAMPALDSLLRADTTVNLIFAHNDRMAIGASEIASRLDRRHNIKIIGIDAAPEIGIRAVADSIIDATFLYPTEGYRLIRAALSILRGGKYEKETLIPASSAVDLTNADVLLLQNETLKEETGKMRLLKMQLDDYWARHSSQTTLFYASIAIIVLMTGIVFLILRAYWQHRRHQKALLEQNEILEQQRNTEKELNVRLQEAIQSKLAFFTNVSHDLRTPLSLIAEPIAQLAEASNLTLRQQTLIHIADKNIRILQRLINQILDFRKYENNKLTLHLTETDLGKAIDDWSSSFRELARRRNFRFAVGPLSDAPLPSMAVDTEKIERVFFNLLSNAFKYTPDGGRIDVSYGSDGTLFSLRVADTGEGISERDLGNIFDRFYQVDRVHPNGSGIGLSLCKAFVELHGGTITAESTPGRGSVFTVNIPVSHTGPAEAATPVPPAKTITGQDVEAELGTVEAEACIDENKPVVLVIDDNRDIRELITTLMGDSYNIITAPDGREGIRKSMRYVPDLVICDVMMPGMDGLECCRRLKEEVTTSHIPVLMLTACTLDEQRVQGYDSGADGYLSKPFSAKVLAARCRSLIDNRRRIKELWTNGEAAPAAPKARPAKEAGDIDSDFYRRFLDIFRERMGDSNLGIEEIASQMGLERTQFYRKIKALTNFAPVELMRNLRLRQAQLMVKTTDRTMSEIAYATGFSSPAYFTRCYREAFGETPTETRSRLKA